MQLVVRKPFLLSYIDNISHQLAVMSRDHDVSLVFQRLILLRIRSGLRHFCHAVSGALGSVSVPRVSVTRGVS